MTPTLQNVSQTSRQAGARKRCPRNRLGLLWFPGGLFPSLLLGLLLFSLLVSPHDGWTIEDEDNGAEELFMGTSLELPDWLQTPDGYVFRPEGKPDPFRPFVRPAPPEESFRAQVPTRALTPLERVEATQLRVIGIVWAVDRPDQALAMVEMPDGKGFVLRPGVGVGRYGGKVLRITANEVIIEEHGLDIAGREQVREVILKLHPSEGDGHG
jgi:Tfp pilus assembly protein PilP